jgi:hypothetical protein
MTKNVGTIDRLSRTTIAVVVAVLFFKGVISSTLGIVLLALIAIFVFASLVSICPFYTLFGIKTCSTSTEG